MFILPTQGAYNFYHMHITVWSMENETLRNLCLVLRPTQGYSVNTKLLAPQTHSSFLLPYPPSGLFVFQISYET